MTEENDRKTLPPVEHVDNRMVALALSGMATTLESIQDSLTAIPSMVLKLDELKGTVNLAGGMAARALQETTEARAGLVRVENALDRIEANLGRLARSVQGLEQASRSLMDSVYPERDTPSTPPTIELADVVPLHSRRVVMTGE